MKEKIFSRNVIPEFHEAKLEKIKVQGKCYKMNFGGPLLLNMQRNMRGNVMFVKGLDDHVIAVNYNCIQSKPLKPLRSGLLIL